MRRFAPVVRLGAATLVALVLLVEGCGGQSHASAVRATPSGAPRASDSVVDSLTALAHRTLAHIPGALPPGFRPSYNDMYHGWPVRPVHAQHPIRGSFLDPRGPDDNGLAGYHFGIDVNVDDRHPEPGAPRGLSHRVYALEGGRALVIFGTRHVCDHRRLEVGHFAYWHVSTIVRTGETIRPGQQIGWTCLRLWHVHVSEWQKVGGIRVWVNPVRPGGKIAPYVDTEPPIVSALRFFAPERSPWQPTSSLKGADDASPLTPTRLHGLVELRAEIEDGQSFWGFLESTPGWEVPHHPYRVGVQIRARRTGAVVLQRISFQSDMLPSTPYLVHYAPGTVQDASMDECTHNPPGQLCAGTFWFRPFSRRRHEFWDTRTVRNGRYDVSVVAWDLKGHTGSLNVPVVVAN